MSGYQTRSPCPYHKATEDWLAGGDLIWSYIATILTLNRSLTVWSPCLTLINTVRKIRNAKSCRLDEVCEGFRPMGSNANLTCCESSNSFLCKDILLFQKICIDAGHVSEKTLYDELNTTRDVCDWSMGTDRHKADDSQEKRFFGRKALKIFTHLHKWSANKR